MKHYLWLLPTPEQSIPLRQVIVDLARGFSQPIFLPHLTLWSGLAQTTQIIEWMKRQKDQLPFTVHLSPPTFGQTKSRCVFIPVQNTPKLHLLFEQTQQNLGTCAPLRPHISLLYGDHTIARRRDVSSTLKLPFYTLTLTEFALVQASEHIDQWKILHRE